MAKSDRPPAPNRIQELREAAGLSAQKLAVKVGSGRSQIVKLERGERQLTQRWMERIARALNVALSDLLPSPPPGEAAAIVAELPQSVRASVLHIGDDDLPIYGVARGGVTGVLVIPVEQPPVARTERPPQLKKIKEAFAIFVHGDSMVPMYHHGQVAYIWPGRALVAGSGVLIVKTNNEALIKELVSEDDDKLRVREYQPAKRDFEIPKSEIRSAYWVLGAVWA